MRLNGGNLLAWLVGALVVLVVGGLIALFVWLDNKDRAAELRDYRDDLAVVNVVNANPVWEDESDGSELEVEVTVEGCVFELERARDENATGKTVNGRKIEKFEAEYKKPNGQEETVNTVSPSPTDLANYMDRHRGDFSHCRKAA